MSENELKLFECRRSEEDSWAGAVLVLAKNKNDATEFANESDSNYRKKEYIISEIKLVEGFLYDDYMR